MLRATIEQEDSSQMTTLDDRNVETAPEGRRHVPLVCVVRVPYNDPLLLHRGTNMFRGFSNAIIILTTADLLENDRRVLGKHLWKEIYCSIFGSFRLRKRDVRFRDMSKNISHPGAVKDGF